MSSQSTTGNDGVDEVIDHVHAVPRDDWGAMIEEVAGMSAMQVKAAVEAGSTEGILIEGSPIVVVTAQGAKSGKMRSFAAMRVEHEGRYALVASIGGAPRNPAWYHNIVANPRVTLQDGRVTREYLAEEVHNERRAHWWDRAVLAYPSFNVYQARCARVIPVFELTEA